MTDALLSQIQAKTITPRPDCQLWFGDLRANGYGRIRVDGKRWGIHRLVYELVVGPIPNDCEIDHLCRVRNCVNPDHMEVVTHAENNRRINRSPETHCPNGHEYTPDNTRERSGGGRACRTCYAATVRRSSEARRARRLAFAT